MCVMVVWLALLVGLLAVDTGPISNPGLSCLALIQREELNVLPELDMLCWHQWEACPFLNRGSGGKELKGRWREGMEGAGGEAAVRMHNK